MNKRGLDCDPATELQICEIKQRQRLWMKEQLRLQDEAEREIKKGQYEMIEIQEDGKVIAETVNLRINFAPRIITNLENPEIIKLIHASKPFEYVWMLVGMVNCGWKQVFLSIDRIESALYLLKKMTGMGIEFYTNTSTDEKWLVRKFVRKLIHDSCRHKWIPDYIGWFIDEDGTVKFYEKEELTWSYVLEKIR